MFNIQEYLPEFLDFLVDQKGFTEEQILNLPDDDIKPYYDEFLEYKISQ